MRKYEKKPQTDALRVNYYLNLNTWNCFTQKSIYCGNSPKELQTELKKKKVIEKENKI